MLVMVSGPLSREIRLGQVLRIWRAFKMLRRQLSRRPPENFALGRSTRPVRRGSRVCSLADQLLGRSQMSSFNVLR